MKLRHREIKFLLKVTWLMPYRAGI
jgi:hypothetical protein